MHQIALAFELGSHADEDQRESTYILRAEPIVLSGFWVYFLGVSALLWTLNWGLLAAIGSYDSAITLMHYNRCGVVTASAEATLYEDARFWIFLAFLPIAFFWNVRYIGPLLRGSVAIAFIVHCLATIAVGMWGW